MNRIKELREKSNLTQAELGNQLNLSQITISGYERGYREPDLETLLKLADFFNVSIDYLLGASSKDIIVLTRQDFDEIKNATKTLEKITKKLDDQNQTVYQNNNNIQIGDHNSISNSFNKK